MASTFDIQHVFDDMPLFGGFTDINKHAWTYDAPVSGVATIRVRGESWEVIDVMVPTTRRGTGSEPYWVGGHACLPDSHPLFGLIKAALEGPRAESVEASIAEDRSQFGRAA